MPQAGSRARPGLSLGAPAGPGPSRACVEGFPLGRVWVGQSRELTGPGSAGPRKVGLYNAPLCVPSPR